MNRLRLHASRFLLADACLIAGVSVGKNSPPGVVLCAGENPCHAVRAPLDIERTGLMTKEFLRFLRRNTIALLALFLALGGTTYAASTALIGRNTVASPQVVNGSLKTLDWSKSARTAGRNPLSLNSSRPSLATQSLATITCETSGRGWRRSTKSLTI